MALIPQRRRLWAILSHVSAGIRPSAGPVEATATANTTHAALLQPATDTSPEAIVRDLQTTGCALIRGVIPKHVATRLAATLAGYTAGGVEGREHMVQEDPMLNSLSRPNQFGADITRFGGFEGSGELFGEGERQCLLCT
jgi:hypothetical protein